MNPLACFLSLAFVASTPSARAAPAIVPETSETGGDGISFEKIPSAATNDAATTAVFSLVDGTRDLSGGDLAVLHDGRLPKTSDEPAANCFFRAGTDGGRIAIDLGKAISVKRIGTYSWHGGTRGPQVYTLYVSDGGAGISKPPRSATPIPKRPAGRNSPKSIPDRRQAMAEVATA